mgnify:CR=1 FL=1
MKVENNTKIARIKIYHNPRCRKSRQAVFFLKENNIDHHIILYLKEPLNQKIFATILMKLKKSPISLIRKNEPIWKQIYTGDNMNDAELINAMILHPKLIARPIVESENSAVVAEPAEIIKSLL